MYDIWRDGERGSTLFASDLRLLRYRGRGRYKLTIEKNRDGAWVIYALGRDGYLVTRSYYGYTKADAVRLFREHMRGEE